MLTVFSIMLTSIDVMDGAFESCIFRDCKFRMTYILESKINNTIFTGNTDTPCANISETVK